MLAWLWGSSFLGIGIGVESIRPDGLVDGRMIGAAVLATVLIASGRSFQLVLCGWVIAAVVGVTGNVLPFLLISHAEQFVDSGLAALIMGVAPIITLTVAAIVHVEETISVLKIVGGMLGSMGVLLLVGPSTLSAIGADLLPQLALLEATMCCAATALLTRRFPRLDPTQMAAGSVLFGVAITCVVGYARTAAASLVVATSEGLIAMVYLGLGPTALAAIIYFRLIPRIGATHLRQVNYVVPVLGVLLGVAILGEWPGRNAWCITPVFLAAVYCVNRRDRQPAILTSLD